MRLTEVSPRVQQISGNKLFWTYYANGKGPDKQLFKKFTFLSPREMESEEHFIIVDDNKVLADAAVQESPYNAKELWIKHVQVANAYQKQGFGKLLMIAIYRYASKHGYKLVHSSFTDDGEKHLKPMITQLNQQFPEVL